MDLKQWPGLARVAHILGKLQSVVSLVLILVVAIILSPVDPRDGSSIFLTLGNLTDILRQVSIIGILALAMSYVILSGGIDLSVGSTLALSGCITALLLADPSQPITQALMGLPPAPHLTAALACALLGCMLLGALGGFIITRLGLQPFIVTLAMMIGFRGLARQINDNKNIDIGFGQDVSAGFANAMSDKGFMIMSFAVLAAVLIVVLRLTVFGRYVRALGDNREASRYSGLPIHRMQVAIYALSGLFAGIAGVLYTAQTRQGNPNAGVAYELDAIAAVVIGGTSLAGGKGSVVGTIIGTLIIGVLTNIFRLRGVDINVEYMVKAVIIIVAVYIQQPRTQS